MNKTRMITYTAIMTALVAVGTIIIAIPVPSVQGYINFGDTVIFISGIFFGPIPAMIAGGFGSAAADLILGYSIWAPFTLIIKGAEGVLTGLLAVLLSKVFKGKLSFISYVIAVIAGGLVMVFGYFFGTWILYGLPLAVASLVSNFIQFGASAGIAVALVGIIKTVLFTVKPKK